MLSGLKRFLETWNTLGPKGKTNCAGVWSSGKEKSIINYPLDE